MQKRVGEPKPSHQESKYRSRAVHISPPSALAPHVYISHKRLYHPVPPLSRAGCTNTQAASSSRSGAHDQNASRALFKDARRCGGRAIPPPAKHRADLWLPALRAALVLRRHDACSARALLARWHKYERGRLDPSRWLINGGAYARQSHLFSDQFEGDSEQCAQRSVNTCEPLCTSLILVCWVCFRVFAIGVWECENTIEREKSHWKVQGKGWVVDG